MPDNWVVCLLLLRSHPDWAQEPHADAGTLPCAVLCDSGAHKVRAAHRALGCWLITHASCISMVSHWGPWHPGPLGRAALAGAAELRPAGRGCMSVSSVKERREKQTEGSPSLVGKSGGWAMRGCLWDRPHNSEKSHYCTQRILWCGNVRHNSNTELCDLFVPADTGEDKPKADNETAH